MKYHVGIVDDHTLVSSSLAMMVDSFDNFEISFEVQSGSLMQQRLATLKEMPDIILLDVNMPGMSGAAVAGWLMENHPAIRVAALSFKDSPQAMRSMFKAGCCAYLLKNTHPVELEKALLTIMREGQYHSNSHINFRRLLITDENHAGLTDIEIKFVQYAASDFTYRHIADLMGVTARTVETYRVSVFEKLKVTSRAGMVVEAMRVGLAE